MSAQKKFTISLKEGGFYEIRTERKRTGPGKSEDKPMITRKEIKDKSGTIKKLKKELLISIGEMEDDDLVIKTLCEVLGKLNTNFTRLYPSGETHEVRTDVHA